MGFCPELYPSLGFRVLNGIGLEKDPKLVIINFTYYSVNAQEES